MKRTLLFCFWALMPAVINAVGTKKKKQKIHVRREFVAITQAETPVEFHSASDTFHSLRCKGTGMQKCDWRRVPRVGDKDFTLEFVDEMVAKMVVVAKRGLTGLKDTGVVEVNRHIRVRYWGLPNGYEYTIEEGELTQLSAADSLTWDINTSAR